MHQQKIAFLLEALTLEEIPADINHQIKVKKNMLVGKGLELLSAAYSDLNGINELPLLNHLKIDFKIGKNLFLYDDAHHFNRYRLATLKAEIYQVFNFTWKTNYQRLCRAHERECLLSGLQERVWNGPPLASKCFGISEEPGDLSGNGAAGWKLNAYNDVQYDLISRLQGFRMIRIPAYENLLVKGSLKRIDQLLLRPDENTLSAIASWLNRKII
ncbi:MAG: hypothetical protein WD431_05920 [Cyclobacteriaceae bacterium]